MKVAFCSFAVPDCRKLSREQAAFLEFDLKADWQANYIGLSTYPRWIGLYNRLLRDLCETRGAPYIAVAENLGGGMELFNDFCHMTDAGIARKTEIIAAKVAPIVAAGLQATPPAAPRDRPPVSADRAHPTKTPRALLESAAPCLIRPRAADQG